MLNTSWLFHLLWYKLEAELFEDMPPQPIPPPTHFFFLFLFGWWSVAFKSVRNFLTKISEELCIQLPPNTFVNWCLQVVCTEGPDRVKELIAIGASFDYGDDGKLHLAREGGHSHNRIVHAADMTGREIERTLLKAVDDEPNIYLFGHHFAIDLLTSQVLFFSTSFFCHMFVL